MSKIITYNLCTPGKDYTNLIEALKKYPIWGRVTESTWIVVTDETCIQIRDNLGRYLDSNDRILVAELTGVAAWRNTRCDSDWLEQYLKINLV